MIAERNILSQLQCPFIVQLLYAFQNHEHVYLVLTWASGGDFFALMKRMKCLFSESEARFFSAEITCALDHLHTHEIIFRDLKPENILLGGDGHILLTDFGLAKDVRKELARSVCGTPEFMAPEAWTGCNISVTTRAFVKRITCSQLNHILKSIAFQIKIHTDVSHLFLRHR